MTDTSTLRATAKRSSFKCVVEQDPDPDPSYLDQPEWVDRKKEYEREAFRFMHVYALCEVLVPAPLLVAPGHCTTFPLGTPGLYGIESDSDKSYFGEVYADECRSLEHMLKVLNVEIIEDAPPTTGDKERTPEPADARADGVGSGGSPSS